MTSNKDALEALDDLYASGMGVTREELCQFINKHGSTLREYRDENARLRKALELIAAGKRPDGTYNRCREACEQLAREALKGKEE